MESFSIFFKKVRLHTFDLVNDVPKIRVEAILASILGRDRDIFINDV
jgi:hypothetical protein